MDWQPVDYFTKSYDLPRVGQMPWTNAHGLVEQLSHVALESSSS